MRKNVFMFPGVGSQKTGMGKSFFDNFQVFLETFEEASDILRIDFNELCFSPTEKKNLEKLENSQLAILTVSVGIYRVFQQEIGGEPHFFMGHSLGEYSALCCAGAIQFPDALELVKQRGRVLDEVASTMNGTMAWVINLDNKAVARVCEKTQKEKDPVYVSAYDGPFQSSISGPKDSIIRVGRELEKLGAIVYPIKMSGPFHSPLLKPAANKIKRILDNYHYHNPVSPVIANYNALPYKDRSHVADNLALQLINPIRWQESIQYIEKQNVVEMVEIGGDKVLKHLLKGNSDSIKAFSIDNIEDLKTYKGASYFKN